jgi:iron-only hydrogenase group A
MQNVWAIEFLGRGESTRIAPAADVALGESPCIRCGQCSAHCPVGAIYENDQTKEVWDALMKTGPEAKTCVVQIAPAVRVALGEAFGLPPGSVSTGKMVTALRMLGFEKVFDTDFAADLTIMEETTELIARVKSGKNLPILTSCCPGWVKFFEHQFPDLLFMPSSAKSPQQMFGAVAKTYYARKLGIDPRKIVVVSVMPCTAKKFEALRPEMKSAFEYWKKELNLEDDDAFRDVDYVLTTREASRLIKEAGINFTQLPEEDFDAPLGVSTGAAVIFGATGGVMEGP